MHDPVLFRAKDPGNAVPGKPSFLGLAKKFLMWMRPRWLGLRRGGAHGLRDAKHVAFADFEESESQLIAPILRARELQFLQESRNRYFICGAPIHVTTIGSQPIGHVDPIRGPVFHNADSGEGLQLLLVAKYLRR